EKQKPLTSVFLCGRSVPVVELSRDAQLPHRMGDVKGLRPIWQEFTGPILERDFPIHERQFLFGAPMNPRCCRLSGPAKDFGLLVFQRHKGPPEKRFWTTGILFLARLGAHRAEEA